jgi:hypothetical protein
MTDFEKLQKINRLAKALKESGLAKTRDEAAKMAEEMYTKSEKSIEELKKEGITAQELLDEEYKTRPEYQKKVELKGKTEEIKEDIKKHKEHANEEELEEELEEASESAEENEEETGKEEE